MNGRIVSVVKGYPDFYNIIYDSDVEDTSTPTGIYTYKLKKDYKNYSRCGELQKLFQFQFSVTTNKCVDQMSSFNLFLKNDLHDCMLFYLLFTTYPSYLCQFHVLGKRTASATDDSVEKFIEQYSNPSIIRPLSSKANLSTKARTENISKILFN